ncbi:hypothetical protein M5K25_021337 [Dendrobium thyrsiflorum]|uniref:UBC core domain-containing protein n=1 Tax=Dendrobium thyrsiflorum TaxID=117978 RepID=A0ABD0UJ40_DENTH
MAPMEVPTERLFSIGGSSSPSCQKLRDFNCLDKIGECSLSTHSSRTGDNLQLVNGNNSLGLHISEINVPSLGGDELQFEGWKEVVKCGAEQIGRSALMLGCEKAERFKQFDSVKNGWLKRVHQEWSILKKNLPESIYVRVYEERVDLMRASIAGQPGTPYYHGLFFFDIHLPNNYPQEPPGNRSLIPSKTTEKGGWRHSHSSRSFDSLVAARLRGFADKVEATRVASSAPSCCPTSSLLVDVRLRCFVEGGRLHESLLPPLGRCSTPTQTLRLRSPLFRRRSTYRFPSRHLRPTPPHETSSAPKPTASSDSFACSFDLIVAVRLLHFAGGEEIAPIALRLLRCCPTSLFRWRIQVDSNPCEFC